MYFSGPAGGRSLRARVPHMARRAVLPKSNTLPAVIGRSRGQHRFSLRRVFKREFLEIGEFVSSNGMFPMFFSHVAFDWRCQFAKQIRNAGAWYGQAFGHVTIFF